MRLPIDSCVCYQEEMDDSHEVAPLGLGEVDENEAAL